MKLFNVTSVVFPHVIEPSFGIGRLMYSILEHNFMQRPATETSKVERSYFSLPYAIASYKCCIMPLNDTDNRYGNFIKLISELLADASVAHSFDDRSGSIGKRYAHADEIGFKYAITLDYETLENSETVTIRERDSMKQIRVKIEDLAECLRDVMKLQF